MSTKYEDALGMARTIIKYCEPAEALARQFLSQHERMNEILAAINTVISDIEGEDGCRKYEEAWAVLKQAVGRKVEP
jgi:hypothetical protein